MLSMTTRDGVRLDADVYYPDEDGCFPILLMRQPYGRSIASTVVYAHPHWYASQGYIVVIQDVRGRGTSEGRFDPFVHEREDGFETVAWAAALPGSTGEVGMYGFSYQGMTQLYAASLKPAALKVICPAMLAYDLCTDMAYEGGAFCLQSQLSWAIQLEAETARLRGDKQAYQALYQASRQLPLYDVNPSQPDVLQRYAPESYYFDWLAHRDPDDAYWQIRSPKTYMQSVDLPMLHIGGWFDTFLRGTLHLYQAMVQQSTQLQHLRIGPWSHLPWGRYVGSQDYGPEAVNGIDQLQLQWFNHFLKGMDTGLTTEPPVRLFQLGSNQWCSWPSWPRFSTSYYLGGSGLAAISDVEGMLTPNPPKIADPVYMVHDPWRPVPSLGGHFSSPSGSFNRAGLDNRSDVVTYTTLPLGKPLTLAGECWVELRCTADQPSFDIGAVISVVQASGIYNLTQGFLRISDPRPQLPLRILLQPICAQIYSGQALRLSLSASCFPAFANNPGTSTPVNQATLIEARIITLKIEPAGSWVSLPIA